MAFIDGQKLTTEVKAWAKDNESALKSEAQKLGIIHRSNSTSTTSSVAAIKASVTNRMGIPTKVSFKFARHLVFVHKGVGKGTPIAKAGTGARRAKEWFEPPIEKNIDKLADIVADNLGESIVNNLKF
jgi:hypothetical protein